jgi:hypothetical protein
VTGFALSVDVLEVLNLSKLEGKLSLVIKFKIMPQLETLLYELVM